MMSAARKRRIECIGRAWGRQEMKMMKAIEVALGGHEGTHRLGFAHMPNNGIHAPPAGAFNTIVSMVFPFCLVARQSGLNGQMRSVGTKPFLSSVRSD